MVKGVCGWGHGGGIGRGKPREEREKESSADHRTQFCEKALSKPEASSAWRTAG
jgi:hypothetical protein